MSALAEATPRNKTQDTKSASKVLEVLRVLERDFVNGFSPGDLVRETGLEPSAITRYVQTLMNTGYAERIAENGRIRLSHRFARVAVQILHSLDQAKERVEESKQRLTRG